MRTVRISRAPISDRPLASGTGPAHPAEKELKFARGVDAEMEMALEEEVHKLVSELARSSWSVGDADRIRARFNKWIDTLWLNKLCPIFMAASPDSAYLQAAVMLRISPYLDCVRESALRCAKSHHDAALLEAVSAADRAGFGPQKSSALLRFCQGVDSARPALNTRKEGGLPYIRTNGVSIFRWRIDRLRDGALRSQSGALSAWDVFSTVLPPVWPKQGKRIEKQLAHFLREAEERGLPIERVPAACVVLLERHVALALLELDRRNSLLSGAESAVCKRIESEVRKGRLSDGDTRLLAIARNFDRGGFAEAGGMLAGIGKLFSSQGVPLPSAAADPAYGRFLEQALRSAGLRHSNWRVSDDSGGKASSKLGAEAQAVAERLFGDVLPEDV